MLTCHVIFITRDRLVMNRANRFDVKLLSVKLSTTIIILTLISHIGVETSTYNSLLPSVLMSKLPSELSLAISRKLSEDDWKFDKIMEELSRELQALCQSLTMAKEHLTLEIANHNASVPHHQHFILVLLIVVIVVRQDKETTKLRVVYDASARSTGPSLNECLHVGPKFNQIIMELLVRFRVHKSAFIANIEKAFLMISVGKQDRDVLRFLWVKDIYQYPPEIQVLSYHLIPKMPLYSL